MWWRWGDGQWMGVVRRYTVQPADTMGRLMGNLVCHAMPVAVVDIVSSVVVYRSLVCSLLAGLCLCFPCAFNLYYCFSSLAKTLDICTNCTVHTVHITASATIHYPLSIIHYPLPTTQYPLSNYPLHCPSPLIHIHIHYTCTTIPC